MQADDIDQLTKKYLALRAKKATLKKKYDTDVADIDAALQATERFFQAQMHELHLTSLPNAYGVPYQQHRTSAKVEDWSAFITWAIANERWDMLTKAVSKDAIEAYKDEFKDLPPGIGWRDEIVVNVLTKNAPAPTEEETA